jgi:pheromone shutdown protein TraB
MTKSLFAIICVVIFLIFSGAGFGGSAHALSPACQAAWTSWNAKMAAHNARCARVEAKSLMAAQCVAEGNALQSRRPNCR